MKPAELPPLPVVCEPQLQPRPWGGRRLETVLGRALPADVPVGESWELCGLAGHESRVRGGPLGGCTLPELLAAWGPRLVGGAELFDGVFPLLIKYLDARETLSVQVHPRPDDGRPEKAGIKHEAWYVLAAEPGAELLIGLRPGVTLEDVRAAVGGPRIAELLRRWPVRAGQCYYLPSGVPHALGAGVLVAEVQTPSDVTYRLYDWDRVGLDGRPRELHVEQALENLLVEVAAEEIVQPRSHVAGVFATVTRLAVCERFLLDRVRLSAGMAQHLPHAEMVVWVVLRGRGSLRRASWTVEFAMGDVVLIPADAADVVLETAADCEMLEVKVPVRSPLSGLPRPPRERVAPPGSPVPLGRPGRGGV